ncbi:acyl carrier protein [Streptomyces sp. NPDC091279]|uniref:acyl carrier protein n=1 Tax=unclassified Streptomyces TaxID=2593676 RepID=UPI003810CA6D
MYDMIAKLLAEEFGIQQHLVTPRAHGRELELDSLSMAELAVIVTDRTGVRMEDVELSLDMTLGEIAERFDNALRAKDGARPDGTAAPAQ